MPPDPGPQTDRAGGIWAGCGLPAVPPPSSPPPKGGTKGSEKTRAVTRIDGTLDALPLTNKKANPRVNHKPLHDNPKPTAKARRYPSTSGLRPGPKTAQSSTVHFDLQKSAVHTAPASNLKPTSEATKSFIERHPRQPKQAAIRTHEAAQSNQKHTNPLLPPQTRSRKAIFHSVHHHPPYRNRHLALPPLLHWRV